MSAARPFWVSWYGAGPFTWVGPWWVSGWRDTPEGEQDTIVAAVMATSEDDAKAQILAAHELRLDDLEWRFVNERPAEWVPFCDRFPRADWMKWPWPEAKS